MTLTNDATASQHGVPQHDALQDGETRDHTPEGVEPPEAGRVEIGDDPAGDLSAVNEALAAWAARSARDNAALIDRLEAMGYAVRGKSEAEVAEVLRHPPGAVP